MEFKRDITDVILNSVAGSTWHDQNRKLVRVNGEAGIGKTTILRRVAFSLAQKDYICLWIKRSYGELTDNRFDTVVSRLNDALKQKSSKLAFFVDDPPGNRIHVAEVAAALERARFD